MKTIQRSEQQSEDTWTLGGKTVHSRFLLGSAQYPSLDVLGQCLQESQSQILTVSLRKAQGHEGKGLKGHFWDWIQHQVPYLLPNTAGARSAREAIETALMSREVFGTNWIKVEITAEDTYLSPDCFELVEATKELVKEGFIVFPYMTEDLRVAEAILHQGTQILMPWASPIGSGQGILNIEGLKRLRKTFPEATLIVDAGIGRPSQATQLMESGFDGILCNTAVSLAQYPHLMARAFKEGIQAGRWAYLAGIMPMREMAFASTSLSGRPFID
jgi:thiazole synthase